MSSAEMSIACPLHLRNEAVRDHLEFVLASGEFANAPRQRAFLRFVVEEWLDGRGEEIKEVLIASVVYGKSAGYDPRIDSTVRVEASKLRQRLGHFYERAGAQDRIRISIPKGSYKPTVDIGAPDRPGSPPPSGEKWRIAFLATAAVLAALLVVIAAAMPWDRSPDPATMKLTRLTEPGSFSTSVTPSPDGEFIVYASDRGSAGILNLWRQPLNGGAPVRLTRSAFNHDSPEISPDGAVLVFRTDEQGGELRAMPPSGGDAAPIPDTRDARNPRLSPRGETVAYWTPRDAQTGDYGRVFLRSLDAASSGPVRLFGDFAHAAYPVWAAETGRHVLALGTWQSNVPDKEFDAWILNLAGNHPHGTPRKTGLFPALAKAGLYAGQMQRSQVRVADWRDGWLYLTVPAGDQLDLFRMRLDPTSGVIRGEPQRLTFGAGTVHGARVTAGGGIVFSRVESSYDLHSLQAPGARQPGQDLRRHTSETGTNLRPALHSSGSAGVWEKRGAGSSETVWSFNLLTGARQKLGWDDDRSYSHALISPDGHAAVYRVSEPGRQPIYLQPVNGGPARRICDNCGSPSDWMARGQRLLYVTGGQPASIGELNLEAGRNHDLLKHPSYQLYGARAMVNAAGDGWLAFYADNGPRTRQVLATRLQGFRPEQEDSWAPITGGAQWDQSPAWSSDGRVLYYVNRHDGFACIMAREFNPVKGKAEGSSWAVRHLHSPAQTLSRSLGSRGADALWVAGSRIYFNLENRSSDLWMIRAPD